MNRLAIKAEALLFNYETTGKTDHRHGQLKPIVETKYKKKETRQRARYLPLKGIHTLTEWKELIPFTLFWKKKEIIREHPEEPQKPYSEPVDEEREEVQRTRPREVMTPAASMDDAGEPMRQIMVKDFYMSNYMVTMSEPMKDANKSEVRSPLPDAYASTTPVYLRQLVQPLVSPEWRMDSVSWDNKSLRGYCNPKREFWLARKPPKCRICDQSAEVEARRKMKRQAKSPR